MAEFPALPFFTDAYLGDTMHLSLEEHGAYLKMLMIAWRSADCALPDDDRRIATMLGISVKRWVQSLRPVIEPFWTVADGRWSQKRLKKVRDYVDSVAAKKRDAANARWNGKALENNNPDDAPAPASAPAPAPAPASYARARNPNPDPDPVREDSDSSTGAPVPATPSPTARSTLWHEMKGWVGGSHDNAGKFLGLQASRYGEGQLVEGYFAARKADPQGDRRAYLTGLLQRQAGTRGTDRSPMASYQRVKALMANGDPYADHDVSHLLALMPSGTVQ